MNDFRLYLKPLDYFAKLGEIVLFITSLSLLVMGAAWHRTSLPCEHRVAESVRQLFFVLFDCDLAAGSCFFEVSCNTGLPFSCRRLSCDFMICC